MNLLLYSTPGYVTWILIGIIVAFIFGVISGAVAAGKGYNGVGFFFFGFVAFPFALTTALLLPPKGYYQNMLDAIIRIKDKLEKQQKTGEPKIKVDAQEEPPKPQQEVKMTQEQIEQAKKDLADKCKCEHTDKERTRYLVYVDHELVGRRELCKDCVEKLKQEGYGFIKV